MLALGLRAVGGYARGVRATWRWVGDRLTPAQPLAEPVRRLQLVRSWVGFAAVVAILLGNGEAAGDAFAGRLMEGAFQAPLYKAALAAPCFLLGACLVAALTPGAGRHAKLVRDLKPLGFAVVVTVVPPGLVGALVLLGQRELADDGATNGPVAVLAVVGALTLPVLLTAYFRSQALAIRYSFRAGEVHPLLPAAIGLVLAVLALREGIGTVAGSSGRLETQLGWLGVAGAVSLAALSGIEARRLWASLTALGPHGLARPGRSGYALIAGAVSVVAVLVAGAAAGVAQVKHASKVRAAAIARSLAALEGPAEGRYEIGRTIVRAPGAPVLVRAEADGQAVRYSVAYRNDTGKPRLATTCPAEGARSRQAPRIQYGPERADAFMAATEAYCYEHPGKRVIVPARDRVVLWAVFPRDGRLRERVTFWWGEKGKLRVDLTEYAPRAL
ncbi:hypothetical protein [Motilibacter aurantiacus]|uniref:hypothetical protein n=1 Tax=Motilibacter aurantiacus TaxID=2714955 RepID=UPI00140DF04E|nr:hypothetical protein [Motilibacter aurantiacus]NHC46316.1 hypothetical protein [Motilibacter aurantiacus]